MVRMETGQEVPLNKSWKPLVRSACRTWCAWAAGCQATRLMVFKISREFHRLVSGVAAARACQSAKSARPAPCRCSVLVLVAVGAGLPKRPIGASVPLTTSRLMYLEGMCGYMPSSFAAFTTLGMIFRLPILSTISSQVCRARTRQ